KDGEDGDDAAAVMPELKIQGGYWYVSYDGGENWERLGRATGYDGTDGQDGNSVYDQVLVDDDYVTFILKDGTTIVLPRQKGQESLIALKAVAKNGGEVKLTGDVELDEPLVIAAGKTVTIDLDGNDLTIASGNAIENNGILTIKGTGLINATTNYAIKNAGNLTILDDATISGQGGISSTAGKIVINNGDYTATSDWSNNTFNHILRAENTQVIINGGTFDATIGGTNNAMLNAAGGSDITINGGEFKNVSGSIPNFPPYIFTYENGGKLTINDGEFYGGWRFNNQATTDIYGGHFTVRTDGQSFQAGNPHVLKIHGGTFNNDNNANLSPGTYVTTGFKALVSNDGNSHIVKDNVDAVISAGTNAGTALNAALADSTVETIVLTEGEFEIDLYADAHSKSTLNIVGTGGTKVKFDNLQARASLYDEFTISNCEILRMPDKSWGHLVFGASGKATGVYTIENCTFNGVGTQGIYINETVSGATYNIKNCTFNGDFGGEGAITIQGNANVDHTVNITGCKFNNIPSTSHKICFVPDGNGTTYITTNLNTDVADGDIYEKN
ncbi:MAG: hypothetical protein IJA37_08105, partial [Alistipes sp.]|nr:hypothetical protein [Alistipes sp.]